MIKEKNSAATKILTSIAFLVMIVVNALANILPIGGVGTGEVSDSYPNLFAPAAITFSIWGVIYILLAMYTLYQIGFFNKKDKPKNKELINRISTLFMFSSFTNAAWIFAWHYKIIWASLVLMAALFIFLMLITLELKRHELTAREKVFVRLPFSVYFGWITVATIANIITFLVSVNWNGFGLSEVFWTVTVIAAGAIIGIITIISNRDFFYGLTVIWAYVGILIKHMSTKGYNGNYIAVIITVSICLALLAAAEMIAIAPKKEKETGKIQ